MATHSNILAWRIPQTEEPGRPQLLMGSQTAGNDEATNTFTLASLVAQLVKNPPAIQETLVQFLDWEDLLEKG